MAHYPAVMPLLAIQNFDEMNGQFNGHNICFQLVGLDYIDDSYLNNFNSQALLSDGTYENYIKNNNYDVDGAVTIFIHYNYLNNSGSSGNAYGIPNHFMSIARWAVTSGTVHSIFGHETGHCLGLYHTFSRYDDLQETVTRNVANSCYNCNIGAICVVIRRPITPGRMTMCLTVCTAATLPIHAMGCSTTQAPSIL